MSGYEEPQTEEPIAAQAAGTALDVVEQRDEIALAEEARRQRKPIPRGNGLLAPERWEMFGRIANTVANTEFVPKGLRGKAAAVMACLLYGDAQGLHPSVALTEIHIVEGKPTMSATLMVGKIRMAEKDGKVVGHRLKRQELRKEDGEFVGTTATGIRGDDGEEDSFTFTLDMARRAGLLSKNNWQHYPEAMCWARCVSQLARMLFPDVFLGQSAYTGEELGLEETDESGAALVDADQKALSEGAETGTGPGEESEQGSAVQAAAGDGGAAEGHPAAEPDSEEPGDGPTSTPPALPFDGIKDATIPIIMEKVAEAYTRKDAEFLKGILAWEREHKKRKRLMDTLEDNIAEIEHVREIDGKSAAAGEGRQEQLTETEREALEQEPEPEPETVDGDVVEETDDEPAAFTPAAARPPEPEPGDIPLDDRERLVVRQAAACAWMEHHHPESKEWRIEAVLATATATWGRPVQQLDDLTEKELAAIWTALPTECQAAVSILEDDALVAMAAQTGGTP